jgi:phosphohistidine phosphatase
MRLLLIRHARAAPSHHLPDAERPLTEDGRDEFAAVARSIVLRGGTPGIIFHSPARRTTETAEILATTAALPPRSRTVAMWLALGAGCQAILPRLSDLSDETTALVGHEPIMSSLTSLLIGGGGSTFSPGTCACLEFDGLITPGQGRLLWVLEPRSL